LYFVVQFCSVIIYPMSSRDATAEDPQSQHRLAQLVRERRTQLGLSVRAAADRSGIARGTWIALEEGTRRTADRNYAAIERTLRWATGSAQQVADGGEPTPLAETAEPADYTAPGTTERDEALLKVLRSDLPEDKKEQIIRLLIAEKHAADRARAERAELLIRIAKPADG
jgi:transcriptional regulator with XRE-family HTH domain